MDDRNCLTRLLKQSILTLCREAVNYSSQLEVDGIVSVTIDKGDIHIVKMHELFLKQDTVLGDSNGDNTAFTDRSQINRSIKQVTQAPDIHYSDRSVTVKEEPVTVNEEAVLETGDDSDESKSEAPYDTNRTTEYSKVTTDKGNGNAFSGNTSLSTQAESIESQLQKLPISKETDIACKKCQEIQPNVYAFESHNLKVHSQYTCQVCLNTFTSRNNMKRHIRIHTGVKPYSCKQCHESFARNDDYKRHLLRHTFNKPFRCSICYTGYSDRTCIKTHMIKEHDGKEQHICSQCGETYVNMVLFQQHKKIHPELNDYSCTICSFTGPNGLVYNKHMLTHGPPKEYKCTHCDVSFCDPFKYTSHLKLHKNDDLVQTFACCFCDVHLPTFEQFQRHEHSHLQARQYACTVCNKQFRYPSNLKEHLMTHIMKENDKVLTSQLVKGLSPRESEIGDTRVGMNANEPRDQEHMEMNNNNVDFDKGTVVDRKDPEDGHSNDYWCAECNHGFETEDLLQDHISNTHEAGMSDNNTNSSKTAVKTAADRVEYYNEPNASPSSHSTSPYEILTQVDNNYGYLYDDSTQKDILQGPMRNKAFEEEMNVDNDDKYNKSLTIDLSTKDSAIEKLAPSEMSITQNAMKEVRAIQHKFGISPTSRSRKSTWTRHIPSLSTGNIPLTAGRGLFSNGVNAVNSNRKLYPTSISASRMKKSQRKGLSSFQSSSITNMHAIKSNYTRETDNNAMTIDFRDSSSNEGNVFSSSTGDARDKTTDTSRGFMSPPYNKPSIQKTETNKAQAGTPTTLNLKVRNPGFEKVVTPDILFKTKAPFTCEVCEETFHDFETFDRHGTLVHRRYICSYCGKVFTSRPNRERHVRYHTGEKPYKCELCAIAFHRGDDLKYHRTTRHPDIKPFVCGICTSTYAQAKDLEKHLQMYPEHRS